MEAKKICNVFLVTSVCLASTVVDAQKTKIDEEVALEFAKNTKAKLEKRGDHYAALISNRTEFVFDYFKPESENKAYASEVSATETQYKTFVAIKNSAAWEEVLFYNTQSEITKNRMTNHKGSAIPFFPVDKKYNSGDIFHNDVWYRTINLSAESVGDVRSLETIKTYFDVKYLVSVYFHEGYYQKERVITFDIPKWLDLEVKEYNFEGYSIQKTETTDKKTGNRVLTYTMENIMPFNRDGNSPSFAKSYPHLLVLSKKYEKTGKEFQIFGTTQDLYNWYKKLTDEVKNDKEVLKETVDELLKGKTTDSEKISAIYYWVQDNIRYIAFEEGLMGFRPESADMVYKNRYGDCKGMANLLKNMLTLAGYDARLTWIGTNDIIYDYSTPSLGVDNHMICTVILNGEKIFLDGTESFISLNDYAQRIQGRQALIEDGDKYMLEKIPEFEFTHNKTEKTAQFTLVDNVLTGTCKSNFQGEIKNRILRYYHFTEQNKREELLKNFLSSSNSNVKIKNYTTSDLENRTIPVNIDYTVEFNNSITKSGDEIYLSLDFERNYQNYDIDTLRTDDFEFDSRQQYSAVIEFEVPSGYKVDYLPDAYSVTSDEYSLSAKYEISGNKVIYSRDFSIPTGFIKRKNINQWNDNIKKLKKFYNDQIVLIKS